MTAPMCDSNEASLSDSASPPGLSIYNSLLHQLHYSAPARLQLSRACSSPPIERKILHDCPSRKRLSRRSLSVLKSQVSTMMRGELFALTECRLHKGHWVGVLVNTEEYVSARGKRYETQSTQHGYILDILPRMLHSSPSPTRVPAEPIAS